MSLFLTFGILVTTMVTFFSKKAQSLSKDKNTNNTSEKEVNHTIQPFSSFADASNENATKNHEVESLMPLFSTVLSATTIKKDTGGLGFLDEVEGSVDGLMSCTETLGFESSNRIKKSNDDDLENIEEKQYFPRRVSKRSIQKSEVKKFPPPLSSLNGDGKPNFFLKPMRKDGRLELMEVKVERLEILKASRKNGRLRLDLIRDSDQVQDDQEDEMENEIKNFVEENEKGQEEKSLVPMIRGGGDGFRTCHEAVTCHDYHLHDMHGWRQPCVVIR